VECDLSNGVKVFMASGHVIACNPREAVIDNKLGEDHVCGCEYFVLPK